MTNKQPPSSNRSHIARMGAHKMHSMYDSRSTTKKARETFLSKFEDRVDPSRVLDPQERLTRARHARKAYFLSLSLKSAKSRREKIQRSSGDG